MAGRALATVTLALVASCGAELSAPPPYLTPTPGKGDGAGSGSDTAPPITATEFLYDLATSDCGEAFSCQSQYPGDAASFTATFGDSSQSCQDKLLAQFIEPSVWEEEILVGHLGYDGAAADDCVLMMAFGDCANFFHTGGPVWTDACYRAFTPLVATGGACALDESCTSGSCDRSAKTCK